MCNIPTAERPCRDHWMGTPEIIGMKSLTFEDLLKLLLMNMPDIVFVVERKRKI
jgi:hypothetical protein